MNYLLFDDDCGICTKFAKVLTRLTKLPMIPMHNPKIMTRGIESIGEDEYWESFHILEGDRWSTNSTAIINLSKYFPLGKILHKIVQVPLVIWMLSTFLDNMKKRRKMECKADFGGK